MQIFYYQRRDRQPNFGDELNCWLWQRLMPTWVNESSDQTTAFVGLGTLINNALPQRLSQFHHAILFTTGVGYEAPLRKIPDSWRIYAVRGPRSADQLGLPADLAITDGALLLRHCYMPHQIKQYPAAFMPHVHHANFAAPLFQQACDQLGWQYIDPRSPVDTVIQQIDQSDLLIAEAMHGAIAADALRVPWISVVTSPRILTFKWHDWCESVGLTYRPHYFSVPGAYPSFARGLRSTIKSGQHRWGCVKTRLGNLRKIKEDKDLQKNKGSVVFLRNQLDMLKQLPPQLSDDALANQLLERLDQRLQQLCRDLETHDIQRPTSTGAK
ncbi:MAG: polysaccharide pyruvyl transferase family protein [Cyanobacteria bacterium P01_C01_bin.73]